MINPLNNNNNNKINDADDYTEIKPSVNSFDIESIDSTLSKKKGATIISCFFNLANTILGAGMLGLPYAFSRSGWILGSLLMILSGISSCFALHFLTLCSLKSSLPASFYSVASNAMPLFKSVIDVAVALKCFGVATSYLIVIGDTMPDVMIYANAPESWYHRQIWITVGFFIVIPLCYLKNVDALKYTSFASICFVFFIMILIILFSLGIMNEPDLEPCIDIAINCVGDKSLFSLTLDTGRVFSIFIFGFTCQQNIFAVVNELEDVNINRVDYVISFSIGMAFCIYMAIALAGYSTYGSNVQSDILLNYPGR
jgi:amino acid permease